MEKELTKTPHQENEEKIMQGIHADTAIEQPINWEKIEEETKTEINLKSIQQSIINSNLSIHEQNFVLFAVQNGREIGIGSTGNISVITGIEKSRKTLLSLFFATSALSKKSIGLFNVKLPNHAKRVLYIDTEQSCAKSKENYENVLRLSDIQNNDYELIYCNLKRFSETNRMSVIASLIRNTKNLGLVIIDGCRDLLIDFNSVQESIKVVKTLLKIAEVHNVHIVTIIHQNKGSDTSMRGHLGTELKNKAETVLETFSRGVMMNIKPLATRGEPILSVAIKLNYENPNLIEEAITQNISSENKESKVKTNPSIEEFKDAFKEVLQKGGLFTYAEVVEKVRTQFSEQSINNYKNNVTGMMNLLQGSKLIQKDKERGYFWAEDNEQKSGIV